MRQGAIQPVRLRHVDRGIAPVVTMLREAGIETVQSCQGGRGHCYPWPTVEFWGDDAAGWEAYALAKRWSTWGLGRMAPRRLLREWEFDGNPDKPVWLVEFWFPGGLPEWFQPWPAYGGARHYLATRRGAR